MTVLAGLRRGRGPVYVVVSGRFLTNLGTYVVLPFLAIYLVEEQGLGSFQAGVLFAVLNVTRRGLGVPAGWTSDRFGAPRTLVLGLLVEVAAYLTFARVSTFGGFVVAVALLGTGGSLNNMASRSVLATTREGGSVVNFSLYYVMINVSALIGPLIGTVLLADDHMRLSFLLAAALHLLFAAGSAVALRRPPVPADADADATPDGVSGTAGAGGPPAAVAPVGAAAMLGVLRDRHLVRYVLLTTGGWALITQFNVALPLALAHQGEPASRAGLLVALNALVVIVAVWLLGTRVERRTTDGRIAVLALSGLVLGAGWLWPAAGGVWSLVVAVVVASIGESLFCAVVDVLVAGMAPDGRVGLYLGYSSLAWAVGGVIGSLVGGCLAWAARHDALAAYWVLLAGPGFVMAVGTWRSRAFLREGVDGRTRLDDTVPAAA